MEITSQNEAGQLRVFVKGRLDAITCSEFDGAMDKLLADQPEDLQLDLHGLEYISSAGLRSILVVGKKLQAGGGALSLTGLHGAVKEVLEISGFCSIFKVVYAE